ncbi:unnamed protein product [Brassicogethes aeneus]|uniref:Helicase domino n=1 Tax=Brassicogethes aeneus TaxID=1431903 RepID=A0A9P0B4C9_BRAAE|nr:unnamed protein product [Brassicogethes aeneus]
MSDETPGAGQGALPPKEGQGPRTVAERPTMKLTHVGGQFVLTAQTHGGVPALAQISPGTQLSTTRIISISPSKVVQTSPLRPSVANQSIVNVLKSRPQASNIRLQLFSGDSANFQQHSAHSRTVKRSLSQPERKDTYAAKLQRVMNHRIVRSKLVKEKYSEHLLEAFYLDTGGNILDLYQYAKRPKSQAYLNYLKEHAIDPRDCAEEPSTFIPQTTPSTPTATAVSSLPGMSHSYSPAPSSSETTPSQNKTASVNKNKASGNYTPTSNQEQIVEKAKQEAYVVQRIADLQKEGLWSEKRLPKVQDMPRSKAHWDFLLEEMVWLAADFAQERKWKKAAAKKCARMVQKYFQDKALAAQRAEKAQEQYLRRIASFCAKEIKNFWNNVEKLVEYKQNTILEEKRKKALDQQLSFIVDQTEKYSQLLAEGMNRPSNEIPSSSTKSSRSVSRAHSDEEFEPETQSDEDDEETIEQEEAAAVESAEQTEEIAALQRESQMELDDLLEDDLLRNYLLNRDNIRMSESDDSDSESEKPKSRISKKGKEDSKTPSEASESSKEEEEEDEDDDDDEEESENETEHSDGAEKNNEHDELKMLVEDNNEGEATKTEKNDDLINDAAAIAESIQPKGNTLSSTSVSTKVPFLLKFPLREYQHIGLDWLVTMFDRKLNGILADEMGLGKTIQTIALLGHLACEKENWGPHLIVVPTSVMLNWEMECKKWCPGFKILTYYGTQKERKMKRTGWTKPNAFHICITSYKLVIQDHQSFRRKKWKYLILDEAQNIKNFKSQRWQLLLNFQTQQRLLLTGTPLQNNLMELWSLMHFLMPNVFQSHREFKEWFSNPVTGMIEGNSEYNESIIKRLHKVLRPFLLRRLKCEVEKQMPKKYEHVVMCRLSKRQRFLYDDYMSRAKTRETLASGNLLSVINVLMQLRKVCNHPNLFEVRPTISPFQCDSISLHIPSLVYSCIDYDVFKHVNLYSMNLLLIMYEMHLSAYQCYRMREMRTPKSVLENQEMLREPQIPPGKMNMRVVKASDGKLEKKDLSKQPPGVKVKVTPQYGVQLVSQQGIVKTIPVVSIAQPASGSQTMPTASLLKTSDKISASFAQLVQTSTGKHLLLTSNPNIAANIPVATTQGGQKLTLLSKQPVSTSGNAGHPVTKAYVKFHITSVGTTTTTSTVTTSNTQNTVESKEDAKEEITKTVGAKFIEQLYSKQNSLDVRWGTEEKSIPIPGEEDPNSERSRRFEIMARVNEKRCTALPLYGRDFQDSIKIFNPCKSNTWVSGRIHCLNTLYNEHVAELTYCLADMLYRPERRIEQLKGTSDRFIFYVPPVKSSDPELQVWHPPPSKYWGLKEERQVIQKIFSKPATPLHHIASAMVTQFPDPRLIQYDCGKLQTLDRLLRDLKHGGHRVLIFTQMTKMLDVLEAFLNFHGHIYLRLDGTTKVDQRQLLMERFNGDKRIFVFILSTRSGGVGVNLTGADTVIFYDSDWNPTMDAQAQDRCHRIGQTRDVHIYRLVSERTIEENILKKANQKRLLGDLAIEGGNFTTAYFKSSTIQDLFSIDQSEESAANRMSEVVEGSKDREKRLGADNRPPAAAAAPTSGSGDEKVAMGALENALAAAEDDQDVQAARTAKAEAVADLAEFDENIPLEEQDKDKEPEMSKAEQEIDNVIKKLSPIERYAMRFIEETEVAWSAEQLAAAAREIEEQKREWELNRVAAMKEEEERRARELEEEADIITFSREDATNQVSNSKSKKFKARKGGGGKVNAATPPQQQQQQQQKQAPKFKKRKMIIRTRTVSEAAKEDKVVSRRGRSKRLSMNDSKINTDADDSQDTTENIDSNKLNGDTDSNSMDSVESESDMTLASLKGPPVNHVHHNSPRTRSRGTVAINLWTLDVSPILPSTTKNKSLQGNHSAVKRLKATSVEKDEVLKDDKDKKSVKRVILDEDNERILNAIDKPITKKIKTDDSKTAPKISMKSKTCYVVLNDIVAEGQYKIPMEVEPAESHIDKLLNSEESYIDASSTEKQSNVEKVNEENQVEKTAILGEYSVETEKLPHASEPKDNLDKSINETTDNQEVSKNETQQDFATSDDSSVEDKPSIKIKDQLENISQVDLVTNCSETKNNQDGSSVKINESSIDIKDCEKESCIEINDNKDQSSTETKQNQDESKNEILEESVTDSKSTTIDESNAEKSTCETINAEVIDISSDMSIQSEEKVDDTFDETVEPVEVIDLVKDDDEDDDKLKENIESTNIPNNDGKSSHSITDNNGIDGNVAVVKSTANRKQKSGSFKSPDCRKSYKKFNKANNKTLDCWLTRSPKNVKKSDDDDVDNNDDNNSVEENDEAPIGKRAISDAADLNDSESDQKKIKSN